MIIAYDASMHVRTMADRHVVSDDALRLLVCRVEYGIVLDVHAVADADCPDVSAQHRTVPYAAVVAHLHCSYDRRGLSQKHALSDYGHIALEFLYYRHGANIQNFRHSLSRFPQIP